MLKKIKSLFKRKRKYTTDEIFEALYIVSDVAPVFIKKEFEEEILPNSDGPVEALAWLIGNCYNETGLIHFSKEPEGDICND